MAIDKNTKSMMKPTSDGNNFGISFGPKDYPFNVDVVKESIGTWKETNNLLGKVSYKGCNQTQLPSLSNGGTGLGKPLGSDGKSN